MCYRAPSTQINIQEGGTHILGSQEYSLLRTHSWVSFQNPTQRICFSEGRVTSYIQWLINVRIQKFGQLASISTTLKSPADFRVSCGIRGGLCFDCMQQNSSVPLFCFPPFSTVVSSKYTPINFMDRSPFYGLFPRALNLWQLVPEVFEEAHCKVLFLFLFLCFFVKSNTSWWPATAMMQLLEVLMVISRDDILVKVNVHWRWNVSGSRNMEKKLLQEWQN